MLPSPLVAKDIEHSAATGGDGAGDSLIEVAAGEDDAVHAASTAAAKRDTTTSAAPLLKRGCRTGPSSTVGRITAQSRTDCVHDAW